MSSEDSTLPEFESLYSQVESIVKHVGANRSAHIEVVGIFDEWPTLVVKREPSPSWKDFKYVPNPTGFELDDQRALDRARYSPPKKFDPQRNETVGLVCGLNIKCQSIDYYPIKYKTKLALIDEGRPHATLSAGAVALTEDRKNLVLHVRSKVPRIVHEAPNRVHCFLGSMRMHSSDRRHDADMSLEAAAKRECFEESGCSVDLRGGKIAVVKWSEMQRDGDRDVMHCGFDVVYLGARTIDSQTLKTAEAAQQHHPQSMQWEGYVVLEVAPQI